MGILPVEIQENRVPHSSFCSPLYACLVLIFHQQKHSFNKDCHWFIGKIDDTLDTLNVMLINVCNFRSTFCATAGLGYDLSIGSPGINNFLKNLSSDQQTPFAPYFGDSGDRVEDGTQIFIKPCAYYCCGFDNATSWYLGSSWSDTRIVKKALGVFLSFLVLSAYNFTYGTCNLFTHHRDINKLLCISLFWRRIINGLPHEFYRFG